LMAYPYSSFYVTENNISSKRELSRIDGASKQIHLTLFFQYLSI
jgi:hypothetical protein